MFKIKTFHKPVCPSYKYYW